MRRVPPRTGQESVWDYPRPPRIEPTSRRVVVELGGEVVADTTRAVRVLETSHPPVYFVPPEDVREGALRPARGTTFCEWKGQAVYHDVSGGEKVAPRAAWSYPRPTPRAVSPDDVQRAYARIRRRRESEDPAPAERLPAVATPAPVLTPTPLPLLAVPTAPPLIRPEPTPAPPPAGGAAPP